jgi:hypothetical protein
MKSAIEMVLVGVLSFAGCAGDGDDVDGKRRSCEELRTHVAELTVAQAGSSLSPDDATRHIQNLEESGSAVDIEQCVKTRSSDFIECSLAASTMDQLGGCRRE